MASEPFTLPSKNPAATLIHALQYRLVLDELENAVSTSCTAVIGDGIYGIFVQDSRSCVPIDTAVSHYNHSPDKLSSY